MPELPGQTVPHSHLVFPLRSVYFFAQRWWAGWNRTVAGATDSPVKIIVDYPLNGSVFPPDMASPTFQWRDPAESAVSWNIDIAFKDGSPVLHVASKGEGLQIGAIDPRTISNSNKLPSLTPEQAAAHTWKPDAATWAEICKHSVELPATILLRVMRTAM